MFRVEAEVGSPFFFEGDKRVLYSGRSFKAGFQEAERSRTESERRKTQDKREPK